MNTTSRRTIAISATGAAVAGALCFGAATPALAHDSAQGSGPRVGSFTPPTLAQEKSWYGASITNWENWLDKAAAKVASSDRFTDAQKADYATQVAAAKQALDALKAAIDTATTQDDLVSALQTGWDQVQWPQWPHSQEDLNPPVLSDAQQLATIQQRADAAVAAIESKLADKAAKVAADGQLTDQQKADYAAQVATAEQELDALKAAVDAATTADAAKTALKQGWPSIDWPQSPYGSSQQRHHKHHRGFAQVDPAKSSRDDSKAQTLTSSRTDRHYGPSDYNKAGTYTVKADTWNSRTPTRDDGGASSGDHHRSGDRSFSGHSGYGGH